MKTIRMYEQADGSQENPRYSWILEAPYSRRGWFLRWKWIHGYRCTGSFVCNDASESLCLARRLGIPILSNGTHEAMGVPVSRAAAASI